MTQRFYVLLEFDQILCPSSGRDQLFVHTCFQRKLGHKCLTRVTLYGATHRTTYMEGNRTRIHLRQLFTTRLKRYFPNQIVERSSC